MAKSANQKLKIVYLMRILMEQTDETHSISMAEIIEELAKYDISAERKNYIGNRQFQLAELKLLVDSVQSAKFITARKSNELIKKIEELASKYEAKQLQRQVYVASRIKTMNESIYYNVDEIHSAIAENRQIRFQYYQWNVEKEMELRHGGAYYQVSPWALSWDDENYYLVAYDSAEEKIKHFRVDKMLHIKTVNELRQGKSRFKEFDMAVYAKKMFGMYGGREEVVKLRCANYLAGAIIDRFGKDIPIRKEDEEHFVVNVRVEMSNQFIHWVMALGNGAQIIGPETVVEEVKTEIARLQEQYL